MSKKILCCLLAAIAAVGMTACGTSASSASTSASVSSTSVSSEASTSPASESSMASESASDASGASMTGVPSPMDEYTDIAALRTAVGFEPLDIAAVAGYTDMSFYTISKETAQIVKTNEKGTELNLRAAKGAEDISGVMGATYTQKTMDIGEVKGVVVNVGTMENVFVAWFNIGDMTYAISAQGGDITQEGFDVLLPYLVW